MTDDPFELTNIDASQELEGIRDELLVLYRAALDRRDASAMKRYVKKFAALDRARDCLEGRPHG